MTLEGRYRHATMTNVDYIDITLEPHARYYRCVIRWTNHSLPGTVMLSEDELTALIADGMWLHDVDPRLKVSEGL